MKKTTKSSRIEVINIVKIKMCQVQKEQEFQRDKHNDEVLKNSKRKINVSNTISIVISFVALVITTIIGILYYSIYDRQLYLMEVENKVKFTFNYDVNTEVISIERTNGSTTNVCLNASCIYLGYLTRVGGQNYEVLGGEIPFTTTMDYIIKPDNKNDSEFSINLSDNIKRDIEKSKCIVKVLDNTNYILQISPMYLIEISYRNDFDNGKEEKQYFAIRIDKYAMNESSKIIMEPYGMPNDISFLPNRVIEISSDSKYIKAKHNTRFNWFELDKCTATPDEIISNLLQR